MDFHFTPEEEEFRQEVRSFLDAELGGEWQGPTGDELNSTDELWSTAVDFTKKVAKRGWIAPAWPKEYGGAGMSIMQQLVYNEEMARAAAPMINGPGTGMVGPTLIVHGTEDQKRRFLPGITSVSTMWCQGYSEPGSGSDLASLQTRADRDGDDYVVNGSKIWTTHAHRADYCFLLARTDQDAPKHRGISAFLLDMHAPGVTVRPLVNLANIHTFNQVFFDNVRVPKENLVGEENRGWYVGVTLLDFERSNVAGAIRSRRSLEKLVEYCKETKISEKHPEAWPALRLRLADLAVSIETGRYLSYRVASMQSRGLIPNYEASVTKLYHSELGQRLTWLGMQVTGLYGQLRPENERWAPMGGRPAISYMESIPATIAGGSSEVQRNVIATRGLDLPRS
jgi:alkylation response protein AidB-like acyl-CoA dehydrogenase